MVCLLVVNSPGRTGNETIRVEYSQATVAGHGRNVTIISQDMSPFRHVDQPPKRQCSSRQPGFIPGDNAERRLAGHGLDRHDSLHSVRSHLALDQRPQSSAGSSRHVSAKSLSRPREKKKGIRMPFGADTIRVH
jgi:hypothetical protein